jgi:copper(I)-binding protein
MYFRTLAMLVASLAVTASAAAHDYAIGALHIGHPYARATVPGQPSGAAYMTIKNNGKEDDKLLHITSPVAQNAQVHTMSMEGNMMKMREVPVLDLPPAARIAMQPGNGYHIMLLGLKRPLKAGEKIPLTLTFEKAGKIEVSAPVESLQSSDASENKMPAMHTN